MLIRQHDCGMKTLSASRYKERGGGIIIELLFIANAENPVPPSISGLMRQAATVLLIFLTGWKKNI